MNIPLCNKIARWFPQGIAGYTLLALLLFFIWAFSFHLDVLVKGSGVIRVESRNLLLQHPEGGVVKQLLVHEGETVTQGQLIAVIDNSLVSEDFAKNEVEGKTLRIREQRLQHELSATPFELALTGDEETDNIVRSEYQLYLSRQTALHEQQQVNKAQLEQRKAQQIELMTKVIDLTKQLALSQSQVNLYGSMVAKGAAAEGSLLQKRSELQQVQTSLNEARLRLPKVQSELDEYQARSNQAQADFMSDAQKQLSQTKVDLSRVDVQNLASEGRRANSRIVSPVNGIVQKLFVAHSGAVINPGGEVIEIAPSKVPLIAEVKIRPEDRDLIWEKMPARLHISAFGSSYANTLEGKITVISADAINDEQNGRYYLVSIEAPARQHEKIIYPGMGVDAYLLTGKRTPLEYFIKPLLNNTKIALSEP
ncbi:HlyD family type I secretion periplasmic adaptor subunit [Budvicia diplopodorum]|uniref:HlyD family type I secretion periplasmic adaptor subunit n=1 Tax=Budvicia diplopodorum TaxID=1119056 RepID=UPI00135AFAD3|nr:HlyD family type I secretion periplasmic adaptor subunit [Budvicia diplopodorum]